MKRGDERAYRYIKIALEDADFYNARNVKRGWQNSPIIEGAQLGKMKSKRNNDSCICQLFHFLANRHHFPDHKHGSVLQTETCEGNSSDYQQGLTETNKNLSEANRIKEKYIGYYFNVNANYLERIEKFRKSLSRKITLRQFDELQNP